MNWIRRTLASIDAASALARVVLPDPGHVLDQQVTLGEQHHEGQPHDVVLALHDAADVRRDPCAYRGDVDRRTGRSVGGSCRLRHLSTVRGGTAFWDRRSWPSTLGPTGVGGRPDLTCAGERRGSTGWRDEVTTRRRVVSSGGQWVTVSPGGEAGTVRGRCRAHRRTDAGGDPVFVGSYPLRLDEKGRLALPVRFRDQVAGGMVIKKGQERCIYGLTMARVAEQSAAMAAMAPSDTAGARMAARMSFGSMVEIEPDKTGRITIPASLREYAGLDRDVVIVGVDTRFEIWDAANWDAYVAEQEAAYADMESEGMPTLS